MNRSVISYRLSESFFVCTMTMIITSTKRNSADFSHQLPQAKTAVMQVMALGVNECMTINLLT